MTLPAIYPIDFRGWPWPFPLQNEVTGNVPTTPASGTLVSSQVSPPQAVLQWTGDGTADHFDVYRSASPVSVGSKANESPIPNPGSPYVFRYTDDASSPLGAPLVGTNLFYRAVAADASGNLSLPSDAVQASIEDGAFVRDPILATLVAALQGDATLVAMLNGQKGNVRFHKRISEQPDSYPFIVLWRSLWEEDRRFEDQRHGTVEYTVSVVHNMPSSPVVVNVLNRVAALLNGEPGKDAFAGNQSVMVLMSMFMGGGAELYTDQPKLWFLEGKLRLVVEFFGT